MEQHTDTQPSEEKPETGRQFFDWLRSTGVRRADGGWIGGVFSAVSQRTGWDATLLRGIGVIALILVASPTAMLYGLAWLLVPDQRGRIHAESAMRGQFNGAVVTSGLLAVLGAVNVFTPINIGGPFAILINLLVIGAVAWGVYVFISRNSGRDRHQGGEEADSDDSGADEAGGRGKAQGPATSSKGGSAEATSRADGKPAWYPKDSDPSSGSGAGQGAAYGAEAGQNAGTRLNAGSGCGAEHGGSATASASYPAADYQYSYQYPTPASESPQERAERRRRRMLTWGLLLLVIPVTVTLSIVSGWFGLSTLSVLALGAAALVVLLAFRHMISAARGRKGNGFVLGVAASVMVVLTLLAPGPGSSTGPSDGSDHFVFGNYSTSGSSTSTAFSNTLVDLRGLDAAPEDGAEVHHAEVNMAFANATVVVPDEARVLVDNGHAMGSLNVRTQDGWFNESGVAGADHELGPEDAESVIELDLNSGFGNVEIYDATTYAEEVEGR